MSLQRKENNLRRAQARFDRVSRRSKQFQIDFRREANSRGRFHTRPHIVRGEKRTTAVGVSFTRLLMQNTALLVINRPSPER